MIPVSSWGRLDAALHEVITLTDPGQLDRLQPQPNIKTLAHGMGRSYGDACLNADGHLWHTNGLDHFQQWDPVTCR